MSPYYYYSYFIIVFFFFFLCLIHVDEDVIVGERKSGVNEKRSWAFASWVSAKTRRGCSGSPSCSTARRCRSRNWTGTARSDWPAAAALEATLLATLPWSWAIHTWPRWRRRRCCGPSGSSRCLLAGKGPSACECTRGRLLDRRRWRTTLRRWPPSLRLTRLTWWLEDRRWRRRRLLLLLFLLHPAMTSTSFHPTLSSLFHGKHLATERGMKLHLKRIYSNATRARTCKPSAEDRGRGSAAPSKPIRPGTALGRDARCSTESDPHTVIQETITSD